MSMVIANYEPPKAANTFVFHTIPLYIMYRVLLYPMTNRLNLTSCYHVMLDIDAHFTSHAPVNELTMPLLLYIFIRFTTPNTVI